jgi:hypothetical protein
LGADVEANTSRVKVVLHQVRLRPIVGSQPTPMNTRAHDPPLTLERPSNHRNLKAGRDEVERRTQQALNGAIVGHGRQTVDYGTRVQSHWGYLFKILEEKELYVLFWAQREHAIRILPKPILKIGFRLENSVR